MLQARWRDALAVIFVGLAACSESSPASEAPEPEEPAEPAGERIDGGRDAAARPNMDAAVVVDARAPALDGAADEDSGQDAGGADASIVVDELAACTGTLKARCRYDDVETACASVSTPLVPLLDGGSWGDIAIQGGAHGSYMEWNEGAKFANPVSLFEGTCDIFAGAFGEPASVTREVLDLRGGELGLYTVFRPACMREGERYPVITWGNGTCGQVIGYAPLLATLASHGFVVVAANSRFTNAGNNEMLEALDLAAALNADTASPLYQRLDLAQVGAMGHSQGAAATVQAARDPRIKALILWNGGDPGAPAKPFLAVSGERDIGSGSAAGLAAFVQGAKQPGAWLFFHQVLETGGNLTGHLTLMMQPERLTDLTVAWWNYTLRNDQEAKRTFVGPDCTLCAEKTAFEYGQRGLE